MFNSHLICFKHFGISGESFCIISKRRRVHPAVSRMIETNIRSSDTQIHLPCPPSPAPSPASIPCLHPLPPSPDPFPCLLPLSLYPASFPCLPPCPADLAGLLALPLRPCVGGGGQAGLQGLRLARVGEPSWGQPVSHRDKSVTEAV